MATEQEDKAEMENHTPHDHRQPESEDDVLVIDLPAPEGWTKKFYPKSGGTPRRTEIIFISPTGEEIKNKKQLDQYLKSHPGGPPSSEFDWGTGDTPRRSARLSSESRARETPQTGSSQKRQRKSSSNKIEKEVHAVTNGESKAAQDDVFPMRAAGKTKDSTEIEKKDAEDGSKGKEREDGPVDRDDDKDSEQKAKERADDARQEKPENVSDEKLPEKEELPEEIIVEAEGKSHGQEVDGKKLLNKEEHQEEKRVEGEEKSADSITQAEEEQTNNSEKNVLPEKMAAKHPENLPVSCEEVTHEPDAPPVSC